MKLVTFSKLAKSFVPAALAVALVLIPTPHRVANARTPSEVVVDIQVTVHNSEIGVSKEVLDAAVEHVLEEAHIKCEVEQADAAAVQLKIDIYREDNGHFKIHGDLSGPP